MNVFSIIEMLLIDLSYYWNIELGGLKKTKTKTKKKQQKTKFKKYIYNKLTCVWPTTLVNVFKNYTNC